MPRSDIHPSSTPKPWRFWLVLSFGALIRFWGLGHKQLWLDELIQAVRSSPSSWRDVLKSVADDRAQAPLDYIVQHYLAGLLGQSEFSLRFHAALFGTLTILVLYYLARSVFDERVALITAILYAVYPLHHSYSQESRPYALFTLLTVCSYMVFWHLLSAGKATTWFAYIVVTTLLFYANYFGMFVVFSQFVFTGTLLVPRIAESLPEIRRIGLALVSKLLAAVTMSIALFIPWIVTGIRAGLADYRPLPEHFGFKTFLRFLKELSDRSFPLSIVLIAFAVLGILKLRSDKRFGHLSYLLCWFLLPLPFIFLLLHVEDYFFAIRQVLFATPALFMLISLGILYLPEILVKRKRTGGVAVVPWAIACVGLMSITQIGLHVPDRREDLKGAGQFLKRNVSAGDVVIAPGLGIVLSFYFPEIQAHLQLSDEASRRNGGLSFPEIHAHLQPVMSPGDLSASLSSGKKVFVVKSRYMSAAEEQLLSRGPADGVTAHQTEFKEIEIIELEEPGKSYR